MKHTLSIITILLLAATGSASAKLYKWVDDNGQTHFGDKIPAKYTDSPHEQLSKSGKVIESVGRAKSREEMRIERLAQEAEDKRIHEERQRQLKQAHEDQILIDTFSTERDIIRSRDDKLNLIDANLRVYESLNGSLSAQVEKIQANIDSYVKQKKAVPVSELKALEGVQAQIDKNNLLVERSNKEKNETIKQFARDLERFKFLQSRRR